MPKNRIAITRSKRVTTLVIEGRAALVTATVISLAYIGYMILIH